MKFILFLSLALGLASCNYSKTTSSSSATDHNAKSESISEPTTETVVMMVNSSKVPCVGEAPQECLQVKYISGDRASDDWENFYSNIAGFEYIPGNIYTIEVKLTHLDPSTVPAGASSIQYELVEIKEVTPAEN